MLAGNWGRGGACNFRCNLFTTIFGRFTCMHQFVFLSWLLAWAYSTVLPAVKYRMLLALHGCRSWVLLGTFKKVLSIHFLCARSSCKHPWVLAATKHILLLAIYWQTPFRWMVVAGPCKWNTLTLSTYVPLMVRRQWSSIVAVGPWGEWG